MGAHVEDKLVEVGLARVEGWNDRRPQRTVFGVANHANNLVLVARHLTGRTPAKQLAHRLDIREKPLHEGLIHHSRYRTDVLGVLGITGDKAAAIE